MPIFAYADRRGELAAEDLHLYRALYLLDGSGRVVGGHKEAELAPIGENFFDLYPIHGMDRATLSSHLAEGTERWLLLHAGGEAILLDCSFHRRCGLMMALLPPDDIAKHLCAPAAYADIWQGITLLPSALAKYKPVDEEAYRVVSDWLAAVHPPLPRRAPLVGGGDAALSHLSLYLSHYAALLGCDLSYDLLGLGFGEISPMDYAFLRAALLSLFLCVRRAARGRAVCLFGDKEYSERPLLHAVFELENSEDPLPELEILTAEARWRDDLFLCCALPDAPARRHLRFSLCRAATEVQGVKDPIAETDHSIRLPFTLPD